MTRFELEQAVASCCSCPLRQGCRAPVFGTGPDDARVFCVGEAPGAGEDAAGLPFVGASGKLLTALMTEAGIDRQTLFITNLVKCRPPNNRTPRKGEQACCLPHLQKQLKLWQPRLVVTLGLTAARVLSGTGESMKALRGRLIPLTIQDVPEGIELLPLFHPAYLLRFPGRSPGSPTDLMLSDLALLATRLKEIEVTR